MPETKGPTRRSSNCAENFLRTKAATDSSPSGGILFQRMSRTRAHLAEPSISELMKNAGGLIGTGRVCRRSGQIGVRVAGLAAVPLKCRAQRKAREAQSYR